MIQSKPIFLSIQNQKENKFEAEANVIVRNLAKDVQQKEIYELCSKFGSITSCKLESFQDGTSRGFCYIQFSKPEEAKEAIANLNGAELRDKKIEISLHQSRKTRQQEIGPNKYTNIFVKGLEQGTDDAKLQDLFAQFGEIVSASVKKEANGNLTDTGFVNFKQSESAAQAVEHMNRFK